MSDHKTPEGMPRTADEKAVYLAAWERLFWDLEGPDRPEEVGRVAARFAGERVLAFRAAHPDGLDYPREKDFLQFTGTLERIRGDAKREAIEACAKALEHIWLDAEFGCSRQTLVDETLAAFRELLK
jgi:hypothetical protein